MKRKEADTQGGHAGPIRLDKNQGGRVAVRRVDDVESQREGIFAEPVLAPEVEAERCRYIASLGPGIYERQDKFDAICNVLADLFDVSYAFVSIFDDQFAYIAGLKGEYYEEKCERKFCLNALALVQEAPEVEVWEDMSKSGRFKHHPLVAGFPYVRFNAYCPVIAGNGLCIGALGMTSMEPKQFSAAGCNVLANFSALVSQLLERPPPSAAAQSNPATHIAAAASAAAAATSAAAAAAAAALSNAGFGASTAAAPSSVSVGAAAAAVASSSIGFGAEAAAAAQSSSGSAAAAAVASSSAGFQDGGSSLSTSVLLLDTSKPSWEILYATEEWRHATGYPRVAGKEEASTSRPVTGRVEGAWGISSSDGAGFNVLPAFWDMYSCLSGSERSEDPCTHFAPYVNKSLPFNVYVRPVSGPQAGEVLTYEMRPASTGQLYLELPQMAINDALRPCPQLDARLRVLYFAVLAPQQPVRKQPQPFGVGIGGGGADAGRGADGDGGAGEGSPQTAALRPMSSPTCELFSDSPCPFPGVVLEALLGRGAYGQVFLASWRSGKVAVKVTPHHDKDFTVGMRQRMAQGLEAVLGMQLHHPNIIETYDHAVVERQHNPRASGRLMQRQHSGAAPPPTGMEQFIEKSTGSGKSRHAPTAWIESWIMLQYCDRGVLQCAIDDGAFTSGELTGAPCMPAILASALEIASGLRYLHDVGVVHGDLTSKNILLVDRPAASSSGQQQAQEKEEPDFMCKVSDFGLSRLFEAESLTTETCGTVTHMPTEMLSSGKMSLSTDVYALGVIMWELYTRERPWAGVSAVQLVARKMFGDAQLEFPDGTPPAYEALVHDCMATDPDRRPKMDEVVGRLEQIRDACRSGTLARPPQPTEGAPSDPQAKMVDAAAVARIRAACTHTPEGTPTGAGW